MKKLWYVIALLLTPFVHTPSAVAVVVDTASHELWSAQQADSEKREITQTDMDAWNSIVQPALSSDGAWFAYVLRPQRVDSELVIRSTQTDHEQRYPVGQGGGGFSFSDDSKWLAFTVAPTREETKTLTTQGKSIRHSVTLVQLGADKLVSFANVQRSAFNGAESSVLVLETYADQNKAGDDRPAATGNDLLIYDLASGATLNIGNVAQYAFDHSGRQLAWIVDADGQRGNGVRVRDLASGDERMLDSDRAIYRNLVWALDSNDRLAVLKAHVEDHDSEDSDDSDDAQFELLGFTDVSRGSANSFAYAPQEDQSFSDQMKIAEEGGLRWSADGGALLFGIREVREELPPDTREADEKVDLMLWHWNEPKIQTQQKVEKAADDNFTFLCTYRVDERAFIRLADDSLRDVVVAPKDRWALAWDSRAYATNNWLTGRHHVDMYAVDLRTGKRRMLIERYLWTYGWSGVRTKRHFLSPDGEHFLTWSDDGRYTVYSLATGEHHPLVGPNGPRFGVDNQPKDYSPHQQPIAPTAWSRDGQTVIASDGWDLWAAPIAGGEPVNLTVTGRKFGIRYQSVVGQLAATPKPGESGVDMSRPWYVQATSHWTTDAGIVRIDGRTPGAHRVLWGPASFSALKAEQANVVAYSRGSSTEFPDYHFTDLSFENPQRATDANPQQSDFLWPSGTVVVDYEGPSGERLQASILLPADYKPGTRYPAIVHIYEHRSQNRRSYEAPSTRSALNGTLYASRGYAVISPDINFRENRTGSSALHCVLAAARAAVDSGIVDEQRVGLTGHSMGGYESAFISTQTSFFKAILSGAAPTNLISFGGTIYWATGAPVWDILESDQLRITDTFIDDLQTYVRESPVFHAHKVTTPMLLLNNDKDQAVDWQQGIEFYTALRRARKPIVMLQYVGEGHGVAGRGNQMDYARRAREFFDHYLMGAPAPQWWTEGIPFRQMERQLRQREEGDADE